MLALSGPSAFDPRGHAEPGPSVLVPADCKWYACYTMANREKKVHALFRRHGIQSYLPLVSRTRQWHDRRTTLSQPLFPGYVFTRLAPSGLLDAVRVPGVVAVVHTAGKPMPLRQDEIENVRRIVEALGATGLEPEPTNFTPGTPARVTSGPFAGVACTVIEQRGAKRVLVGLESIGIGFSVDLPIALLAPDQA